MIAFKCKMCGGEMELEEGATVAECPYCMTKQTLPKLDNEKRANMYDRANHFRRQNEYDKAMAIFESILQEDRTDAEAYWSLVLCRYGIEYVEDPATHKRVPTVNRVQYTSILADEDYKSALEYADFAQRSVYEAEAKAIDEIQKGILAISKQEKPFDVFICYKETDANGRRTPDSVLANDLYHQLSNEGFKVFFSRITLEDKIGTAYEPYIFAALNSAKVMVVLGTKSEYFNAVWVKNEWSRYLALIRAGADKTLVPAYRDMDPYDLPEEFSHLQAQDMSKLGFMQDLIRGIKKIVSNEKTTEIKPTSQDSTSGVSIKSLMKRATLFLEDRDFENANEYLDKVLDVDPEYAPAYVGKTQVAVEAPHEADLAECLVEYENSSDWKKAIRFANPAQKAVYEGYVAKARERREEKRKEDIYQEACNTLNNASTPDECNEARKMLSSIPGYRDSDKKQQECLGKAKRLEEQQQAAIREAEKRQKEAEQKKKKKITIIVISIIVALIALVILMVIVSGNQQRDLERLKQYEVGNTLIFGSYEQDNDLANGKEPINWLIIRAKDKKRLIISEKILDYQYFNTDEIHSGDFGGSYLDHWLRNDFITAAFSDSEKKHVSEITLLMEKNYLTSSHGEEQTLYLTDEQKKAKPTKYAEALGCDGTWFLRGFVTTNYGTKWSAIVKPDGYESSAGPAIWDIKNQKVPESEKSGVRPAIWLDVSTPIE